MKKIVITLGLCFTFLVAFTQNSAKIDFDLQQEMSLHEMGELIRINIILNQQYDQMEMRMKANIFPKKEARRTFVVNELKRFSEETQLGVMNLLSTMPDVSEVQSFWIANFINCYTTNEAIEELSLHPDVLLITFDKDLYVLPKREKSTPADSTREITYNITKVQADQVWELGYEGEGVVVAVLDTGVNYNHNDLKSHMWEHPDYPNHGWNFVYNNNNPMDDNGHGTHCAGTVAGDGTSGSQTGMAPKAKIMAVKVIEGSPVSAWCSGVEFAVEHGAHVLSMSFGSAYSYGSYVANSLMLRNTMVNTLEAGVVASIAAGNEGDAWGQMSNPIPNNIRTPGNCPPPWLHPDQTTVGGTSAVVSIGATDSNDAAAYFTSKGPVTWESVSGYNDYPYNPGIGLIRPDVCAPGVDIKSLAHYSNTGYESGWDGTSMATPCVAGTMALMLSKNIELTPAEICEILETTAVRLPNSSSPKGNTFGSGRIDALAAVNAVPELVVDIVFEELTINDVEGNNNGRLNPGETVGLTISMKNITDQPINNVTVTFKTTDELVNIVNGEADFGDFAAEEVKTIEDAFTITLSEDAVSESEISCTIEAAFEGSTRKTEIQLTVHDFILNVLHVMIPDKTEITPGETSGMRIYIDNTGDEIASDLIGKITTTSPDLIINESTAHYGELYPGKYKYRDYSITISPETPSTTTYVPFTITVTEKSGRKMEKNEMLRLKNIGQPPLPCNPVEDLSIDIMSSTAVLTWTAPEGSVPEKYLVYCNDEFLGETTAVTYTQTDIAIGTYNYCIEALYSDGCTSDVSCVEAIVPCDLIVELVLEPDDQIFHLSWLPALENVSYNIYRDSEFLINVEENSYADTDIDLYKSYCYTVTVVCIDDLESEPSNEECDVIIGIDEMENQVKIYPNPTGGELNIESGELRMEQIQVFDVTGRCLQEVTPADNTEIIIDISRFSVGIYFLQIQTETGTIMKKVVKN